MKKVILGLGALCLLAFTSCKDNAAKKINDKTVHDFGEIVAKTQVETVFNYQNVGDAPLVITDIKSSCGCTVPKDWSRAPLAPGESGRFTVKFNGSGTNKITKTITVTANTEKGSEVVTITAFVKPEQNSTPLMTAPNS